MGKVFSFFSNTVEEFEPFIKRRTFYWPRSIAKKTKYQQDNNVDSFQEDIGDTVFIVSGAEIKNNIKDPVLKEKITGFPMITHKGTVKEVYTYPVLGYRYTHGRNPSSSFMLPFQFLDELLQLEVYLGKPFTSDNRDELLQAIRLGEIIQELIQANQIEFKRAYFKEDVIYIQNEAPNSLFRLDNELSNVTFEEAQVTERLTYREMPSKKSMLKIVQKCNEAGLSASLIRNLRTWRGKEFVKVSIDEEIFEEVAGKLQEGVSTRLILKEDNSDNLITEIKSKAFNEPSNSNSVSREEGLTLQLPKNQILYGPPGTGKTYTVIRKAIEIVAPSIYQQITQQERQNTGKSFRDKWMEVYKEFVEKKQIQFCTFHQSFSYEDFVEGLRSDADGVFRPSNGIFLDICREALEGNQVVNAIYEFDEENTNFYKMSLGRKGIDEDIYQYCIENNVITLGFGDNLDFSACKTTEEIKKLVEQKYKGTDKKETVVQAVSYFKQYLELNDIVLVSNGNSHIRAIGRVIGEYKYNEDTDIRYNHFRDVEWLYHGGLIPVEEVLIGRKLMMRSIYKFDKENLDLEAIQKLISTVSTANEQRNYVLIIDEINRGNISRIFGELITLIEEDKRLGEKNEISVRLPYSRKPFEVPSNLYLVGTMNTADRSITLLDIALRRRFEFIEMLPDISLLPEDVEGVNVRKLVRVINERIEYLYDRDHTIGHAFFLVDGISGQELIRIMLKKVIPLLQEYFYDDWEKIALVLGGAASDDTSDYFIRKETIKPNDVFPGIKNNQLEDQTKYTIVSNPSKQALIRIYDGNTQ